MTPWEKKLDELIYGDERFRRFTQDSPVMPDVWLEYGKNPHEPQDLLLTPHDESTASALGHALRTRLEKRNAQKSRLGSDEPRVAYNESYVVAELDFAELIQVALPLTGWWRTYLWRGSPSPSSGDLAQDEVRKKLREQCARPVGEEAIGEEVSPDLVWFLRLVEAIEAERMSKSRGRRSAKLAFESAANLISDADKPEDEVLLWRVSRNRKARTAISRSILAVKADAATLLFQIECSDVRWAVIDSGIDATHPAFRKRDDDGKLFETSFEKQDDGRWANRTRVVRTYDFTRLRKLLDPSPVAGGPSRSSLTREERTAAKDLRSALQSGRAIDWDALEPLVRIPHEEGEGRYTAPTHEHGTHVAGILTADWKRTDPGMPEKADLVGIAKGVEVYDLRVLGPDGSGDEFTVIAALQFVRHLNARSDVAVVHGVNISLSIQHEVANYACGRTPVCDECERLVGAGTVVVAAAGNDGYARYVTPKGEREGYHSISITDPGNAEGVITVGATHRYKPHTYGVSYFSSRGPTGDGRVKPDLVAPGEKIAAPIPGKRVKSMDGTSMAAPHVSAAAALLMARHRELAGDPARIKRVLCESATDLGRERYFQGNGMLDILRALQAV